MKVLHIETQAVETDLERALLTRLILMAQEAGYTHVRDHWGHNAWDEYTIDEAVEKCYAAFPHEPEYVLPQDTYDGDPGDLPF